jgi:hypothetical protein
VWVRRRSALPREGSTTARIKRSDIDVPLVNYSVRAPSDYVEGDIGGLAFYARQPVSFVHQIQPAGEIIRKIAADACDIIASRLAPLTR